MLPRELCGEWFELVNSSNMVFLQLFEVLCQRKSNVLNVGHSICDFDSADFSCVLVLQQQVQVLQKKCQYRNFVIKRD